MTSSRFFHALPVALALALVCARPVAASAALALPASLPVRVVVVTTFEVERPESESGEYHAWLTGLPLHETIPFPQAYHDLGYDPELGVLGIVTGEGAERGAASIMALGSDPRFDLSKAYWIVAGIAGVDPNVASVGSAAWAHWVVNADLGFEVDARDMPAPWSTGIVPFDRAQPFAQPAPRATSIHGQEAFELNAGLVQWAYGFTATTPLPDTENLRRIRASYSAFPNAARAPFVLLGDSLCGDRYWTGAKMNAWAERWVPYWTGGKGVFATTAEEDAGIMQSLTFLGRAGRVDPARVLVLRTASDYAMPGAGTTVADLLAQDASETGESAYVEALDAAYRVGSPVVRELAGHWDRYADHVPVRAASP